MMPASVDLSAFFIELAEEMELTFCEQIDNGCPVLLGLWNNVLKAEVRLYRLLGIIDQFRDLLSQLYTPQSMFTVISIQDLALFISLNAILLKNSVFVFNSL